MKSSKILLAMAIVGILIASSTSAEAYCDQVGKVIYLSVLPSGNSVAYISPLTATPTFYYSYTFSSANHAYVSALGDAMASGQTVTLWGSAASCPTTGTVRAAGALQGVFIQRNR